MLFKIKFIVDFIMFLHKLINEFIFINQMVLVK